MKQKRLLPEWLHQKRIGIAVMGLILCVCAIPGTEKGIRLFSGLSSEGMAGVYSEGAKEVYSFIRTHVGEEETIGFGKPRALYLNTGRVSFRPDINGHSLDELDYFLVSKRYDFVIEQTEEAVQQPCIFENDEFALYDLRQRITSGSEALLSY